MRSPRYSVIALYGLLSVLVLCAAPFFGQLPISLSDLTGTNSDSPYRQAFWELRVPRSTAAFFCGMGLSVGGLFYQTLFKNVLATPYTLGVSTGAALGATVFFALISPHAPHALLGSAGAALIGALAITAVIFMFARYSDGVATSSLLLAGVALSYLGSSLIVFLQYLSDLTALYQIARWLMGGFEGIQREHIFLLSPIVLVALLFAVTQAPAMNVLVLGDDTARGLGIDAPRRKFWILFGTAVVIGAVVSVCGPIGFVGVVVPHVVRALEGHDMRIIIPLTAIVGGAFLVVCDVIARTAIPPFELPVGIVTSLLGGPYFLWILAKQLRAGQLSG